jgi:hypothetical protein
MCGNGGVATGVREVATVEELTAALNDAALHYVRITQDLLLMQQIVFNRATPLVVEGACGGGTRGCTIAPVVGSQTRFFSVSRLALAAHEELSFIGLTFTGGNTGTWVRPPIGRCGAPELSNCIVHVCVLQRAKLGAIASLAGH